MINNKHPHSCPQDIFLLKAFTYVSLSLAFMSNCLLDIFLLFTVEQLATNVSYLASNAQKSVSEDVPARSEGTEAKLGRDSFRQSRPLYRRQRPPRPLYDVDTYRLQTLHFLFKTPSQGPMLARTSKCSRRNKQFVGWWYCAGDLHDLDIS
ncbi:hypothetical protein B0T20DRAFT_176787 [Sordaria brevicollis]|uniref:Uncharacterized protein n=1 Tax=Sordaria brevicollis TaxID=83679 RepID=A0AAE0PHI1_SORBR|nr:hypothetical protein B0T20DRAFT_176787 [Sordaria brevicollis]